MVTFEALISRENKIAVVGLGYVGLPLAVHLAAHFDVVGFDLKTDRIKELESGIDRTLEVTEAQLKQAQIHYTDNPKDLSDCRLIIVAVPTPIDDYRIPDLGPLQGASTAAGRYLQKGTCIVYESTVYPGATEEVCIPILETESGLKFGRDLNIALMNELAKIFGIIGIDTHEVLEAAGTKWNFLPFGVYEPGIPATKLDQTLGIFSNN